jgi:hypothetical protein
MRNLHQDGVLKDMSEIALALFYELQPTGTSADGTNVQEKSRRALAKFREIFGLHTDVPPKPKQVFDFQGIRSSGRKLAETNTIERPTQHPRRRSPQ